MLRVVFVGTREDLQARLLQAAERPDVVHSTVQEGGRPPRPPGADLLVLGPDCAERVREAQRWFHAGRTVLVLVLAEGEHKQEVHARAMTAPYIGKGFLVADSADEQAFAAAVARAGATTTNRRALRKANAFLARVQELV